MNAEDVYWSWVSYSYLIQIGVFANLWLTQIAGAI